MSVQSCSPQQARQKIWLLFVPKSVACNWFYVAKWYAEYWPAQLLHSVVMEEWPASNVSSSSLAVMLDVGGGGSRVTDYYTSQCRAAIAEFG